MASRRLSAWGALILVGAALLAAARSSNGAAPDTSKQVCTLSDNQTNRAIAAFAGLMPVFHHDRCANCHHKIDPFAPSGHVDIREEFQRYRDRAQVAIVARDATTNADTAHAVIGRYLDGRTLTPSERTDLMFSNACSVCHDPPPGVRSWRMPPPPDSFHDKDARKLCAHIHTNDLTNTPTEFVKHMRDDAFIKVGFLGTRGLNGLGESIASPYRPKPIVAPNHSAALGHASAWIIAQRDEFSPNPECGCRPFRYAFDWSANWELAAAARRSRVTGGAAAKTKIPIKFKDDGTFTGEGGVPWNPMAQAMSPGTNCTAKSESKMKFRVKGRVTREGVMEIEGVTELDAKPTTVTCQTRDGTRSFSAPMSVAGRPVPFAMNMKAETGTQVRKDFGNAGSKVTIEVTLVEER